MEKDSPQGQDLEKLITAIEAHEKIYVPMTISDSTDYE